MPAAAGRSPTTRSSACCAATASAGRRRVPGITTCAVQVLDAAVEKAYGGKRNIVWFDVHAGDVAREHVLSRRSRTSEVERPQRGQQRQLYLPDDTLKAFEYYGLGLKGPLTTPIGGGFRSINVFLRIRFDLYACVRPVQLFQGRRGAQQARQQGRYGHLPREHRRRVLRHRVQERHRQGQEGDRPAQGIGLRRAALVAASASSR